jgi:hypothetical protein
MPSRPGEYVSFVAGLLVVIGHLSIVVCMGGVALFEGLVIK